VGEPTQDSVDLPGVAARLGGDGLHQFSSVHSLFLHVQTVSPQSLVRPRPRVADAPPTTVSPMGSPDRRPADAQERRSVIALLVTVFTTATATMAQDTV